MESGKSNAINTNNGQHAIEAAENAINEARRLNNDSVGCLSDGYHTFNELYHHRALLFASICLTSMKHFAWKSLQHSDPNDKMYDGMFIVGVTTPFGQATYHYNIDPYWEIFKDVPELERAPVYDGHTPSEAIERIYRFAGLLGIQSGEQYITDSFGIHHNISEADYKKLNLHRGATPEVRYIQCNGK